MPGWIEWNGGECPVDGYARVEIQIRHGLINKGAARTFQWRHGAGPFGYENDDDIVAYRLVDAPSASTDGWIEWRGGQSPVADDVKVDARFRRGNVVSNMDAGYWNWEHPCHDDDDGSDVIAYRLSKPSELPEGKRDALSTQVGGEHYLKYKIQPFQYSMANKLDPCQHTAIKYITRFRDDGGIEDLEKAKHVIDILIAFERDGVVA